MDFNAQPLAVGTFQANCWLAWGAAPQAVVIDPGGEAGVIRAFLEERSLVPACYLLTHGHMDHVSALGELHDWTPAPIAIHPADASWAFTDANRMDPWYPTPRCPVPVACELIDGYSGSAGGLDYEVLATPGHTPGSVCIHFPVHGALFTGDTLFQGSVGRTDLPGGDGRVLAESLKRLAQLPDALTVYPGHGPQTTIGEEKRSNYFLREPASAGL